MRKNYLSLLLGLGLCAAPMNASIIKVNVANVKQKSKAVLTFADKSKKEIAVNESGQGSIELKGFTPQYVKLGYGRSERLLYLDPAADLSMSFDGKKMWKAISFTGKGAAINTYLNDGKVKQPDFYTAQLEEKAYIQKTDSFYHANIDALNKANLPAAFVKKEKSRLKYFTYANFPMYTMYNAFIKKVESVQASEQYYKYLKDLTEFNPELLQFQEYKEYLFNAISALGLSGKPYNDMYELLKVQLEYIENHVKDATVREYIVHTVTYNYIKRSGIDNEDMAVDAHNKFVKNATMNKLFNETRAAWKKIAVGSVSPIFKGEDINGKTVTLNELKGKFIYIDVWATWCGPCRGELPHLKKLEEQYKGKDIEFVSLSCDQNKSAWKKTVEKEQLKGVQLHIGQNSSFANDYMISGIPRFILLDKEGKIISSNMTRPSDPATAKKFNELLGL